MVGGIESVANTKPYEEQARKAGETGVTPEAQKVQEKGKESAAKQRDEYVGSVSLLMQQNGERERQLATRQAAMQGEYIQRINSSYSRIIHGVYMEIVESTEATTDTFRQVDSARIKAYKNGSNLV